MVSFDTMISCSPHSPFVIYSMHFIGNQNSVTLVLHVFTSHCFNLLFKTNITLNNLCEPAFLKNHDLGNVITVSFLKENFTLLS